MNGENPPERVFSLEDIARDISCTIPPSKRLDGWYQANLIFKLVDGKIKAIDEFKIYYKPDRPPH